MIYNSPILLTNDDGYDSYGLKVLSEIAEKVADNIWIVAPFSDQSGVGQSVSIRNPIKLDKKGKNKYIVHGTPVDCVLLALKKIINRDELPKLVFSGINIGANLGNDIYYSGTFGGAAEGAMNKINSVALSLARMNQKDKLYWSGVEKYGLDILNKISKVRWNSDYVVNINFPNIEYKKIKGIKFTYKGKRKPGSFIKTINSPYSEKFYWISSSRSLEMEKKDSDVNAIQEGYVSISLHSLYEHSSEALLKFKKDFKKV